ncbi:MAG: fumarylacetoacetate hydrolase family protein, partial [Pseudomonadota bacterium]|nr:fumarylacetoacetate hydrolase family protein [Pseudomonadota bacterium]
RFRAHDGRIGFGVVDGERIAEYGGDMFGASSATGTVHDRDRFRLIAPCTPSKIVALWNNFHALAEKLGKAPPAHALFLIKPASCVIGSGESIRRPVGYAGKIVFEGELGIVIGRHCKNVAPEAAADHIFGFTCVNDVTAAEVLNERTDFAQWCRSKGYDTFGCLGPYIASQLDLSQARVLTRVDGVERQNYALSDMIMSPPQIVSQLSHDMTLLPGDVIACGTSLGVGSMRDGASVDVEIAGIGIMSNLVAPA